MYVCASFYLRPPTSGLRPSASGRSRRYNNLRPPAPAGGIFRTFADPFGRYSRDILLNYLKYVSLDLEFDESVFKNLLFSITERFRQVREATEGKPIF